MSTTACALRATVRLISFKMQLHGFGVRVWQHDRSTYAACRADCAEQVGVFVTLISRLAGTRAFAGPDAGAAILLADACFVLPPNFDTLFTRQPGQMGFQRDGEVF